MGQFANCILHGALSITGLTAVVSGKFDTHTMLLFWSCDLLVFVLVESIEVARLWSRIQAFGFVRAAFGYRMSQWARNFTFGMFYAFTLAFVQRFGPGAVYPWLSATQRALLSSGQYIVLALLIIEFALAAIALFSPAWQQHQA